MFNMLLSKGVRVGLAVVFGLWLVSVFAGTAHAANTYTVNVNSEPLNGNTQCDPDPPVKPSCTLREAINAANAHPGATINFALTGPSYTIAPTSPLPPITAPVTINGYSQQGSAAAGPSTLATLKIELDGTNAGPDATGLEISVSAPTGAIVKGLVINRFRNGISIFKGSNHIEGNYIGVNVDGTTAQGNTENGIVISDPTTPGNTIGGDTPDKRNIISGNHSAGIWIVLGENNKVLGNFIGTDKFGTMPIPNGTYGVLVNSSNNFIGAEVQEWNNFPGFTSCSSPCNLISGNGTVGIKIEYLGPASGNQNHVQGNFIGTTVNGQNALGNGTGVIVSFTGGQNTIGGTTLGTRNLIAGNDSSGIALNQTPNNKVLGNVIGTGNTKKPELGNCQKDPNCSAVALSGIYAGSQQNTIGGTVGVTPGGPCTGACNSISGNKGNGVSISSGPDTLSTGSEMNKVFGNSIIGNTGDGIQLAWGSKDNDIGDTNDANAGNVIAFNAGNGIRVDDSGSKGTMNNRIYRNSIFSNGKLGIDLTNGPGSPSEGVTPNDVPPQSDPPDQDSGANGLQNFPVLALKTFDPKTMTGSFTLTLQTTPGLNQKVTIEWFSSPGCSNGEGQKWLGHQAMLSTGADGSIPPLTLTGLNLNDYITATATTPDGTSEFSKCFKVSDGFIVDTTADQSQDLVCNQEKCSLRGAITAANNNNVLSKINFNIVNDQNCKMGICTITLTSALPDIKQQVIIDGTTQCPACQTPVIELDGTNLPGGTPAVLHIIGQANKSTVRGLVINRAGALNNAAIPGILLETDGNTIARNFIGTDAAGAAPLGNGGSGILIKGKNNTIGGTTATNRNVISGNKGHGVEIAADSNTVSGNYIGTNAAGSLNVSLLGNSGDGVHVSSSSTFVGTEAVDSGGNLIAFNKNGVVIETAGKANLIVGNSIVANQKLGIDLGNNGPTDNDIVDPPDNDTGANNLQNFPVLSFVAVGAKKTKVGGTLRSTPGKDFRLEFFSNPVCNPDPLVHAEGQNFLGFIPKITTDNTTGVADFTFEVTKVTTDKCVTATATGPDGTSEFSLWHPAGVITVYTNGDAGGSCGDGCTLRQALGVSNDPETGQETIRFSITPAPNQPPCPQTIMISTLPEIKDPVIIDGYTQNLSKKNNNNLNQGTNANLCIQLSGANSVNGLVIDGGGGGAALGTGTIIQGLIINNVNYAIYVSGSSYNIIRGNFLGTDSSGMKPGSNITSYGVYVTDYFDQQNKVYIGSTNNLIGLGDDLNPSDRNLISGNTYGALIYSNSGKTSANTVRGNLIGTKANGTDALPNTTTGGLIDNGSPSNIIDRNVISGNGEDGVNLQNTAANGNFVQGNLIGTDASGSKPLPNQKYGVRISGGSSSNTVGDTLMGSKVTPGKCDGPCNLIANNAAGGVFIQSSQDPIKNSILANSIHDNTGLGIDLDGCNQPSGVTLNDSGCVGSGPNNHQNFPVIYSTTALTAQNSPVIFSSASATNTEIKGTLHGAAKTTFRLDFFSNTACDGSGHGEGKTFLVSKSLQTNDTGNQTFDYPFGVSGSSVVQFLSATATDPDGNTSEFSQCPDADADGILNNIDVDTLKPDKFSDLGLSGTTQGTITDRGTNRDWFIQEIDPATPSNGIDVLVGPGTGGTLTPTGNVCTANGNMTTLIDNIDTNGAEFILFCSSTNVKVRTGSVNASATVGHLKVNATLISGQGVKFNVDSTNKSRLLVTNLGSGTLSVTSTLAGGPPKTLDLASNATQSFYNDETPPEAFVQFDPVTKDVLVFGRDNDSGVAAGAVAPVSVIATKWGNGDDKKDEGERAELRTYKIADLAGNTLVLIEKVKKDGKEIKATLVSLQYNGGTVKTAAPNQESFEWSTEKDGSIKELDQKMEVGTGVNKQTTEAKFDAKKNQTTIEQGSSNDDKNDNNDKDDKNDKGHKTKTVKPGLVLLHLDTNQGALSIGYDDIHPKVFNAFGAGAFLLGSGGGLSISSPGNPNSPLALGYGRLRPNPGNGVPNGIEILDVRQGGVLVSEAEIPASRVIQSGRIYAEINGTINTGIAMANPNDEDALVDFYFTDASGHTFGNGSTVIPANRQIARYLSESPFNGEPGITGTFTFTSSVPVAAAALRGRTNERSEFLVTALPVTSLSAAPGESVLFPSFVNGGGWRTQIVLVNPTDTVLTGTAESLGTTARTFSYSIAARSSALLTTSGARDSIERGPVRVIPDGNSSAPSGLAIFSYRSASGITTTETAAAAIPSSTAFRLYAEGAGTFGQRDSLQTGVAIANASSRAVPVTFGLTLLDGTPIGLSSTIMVPGNGETALFMNQIPGFESLNLPFQGVLRLSTDSASGISVVGLRGRYNERNEFIIAATAPVDEASSANSGELIFPHVADGGGYSSQFVLFGSPQESSGTLMFFSQAAEPLGLNVRPAQ